MKLYANVEINRWTGRKMSPRYYEVASGLAHVGLRPGEYVRRARNLGCSYRTIGEMIAAEVGGRPPVASTLNYWERVE